MAHKTARLIRQIKKWGADLAGVADLSRGAAHEALSDEFKHFTRAISMAIHVPPGERISSDTSNHDKHVVILRHVKRNRHAVNRLNEILKILEKEFRMRRLKFLALPPVDNVVERRFTSALYKLFPHRMAATCAGLGWIGKNGMLLNSRYGPNLVWATMLTNAPLHVSEQPIAEGQCAACSICEEACPVSAIKGITWRRDMANNGLINLRACAEYMETNARVFGRPVCGVCFLSCPVGRKPPEEQKRRVAAGSR